MIKRQMEEQKIGGRQIEVVRSGNGDFGGGGMVVKNTGLGHNAHVISNSLVHL